MSEQIDWATVTPHVRHRHCPGCKEELSQFILTARQLPIEQFTMGQLQTANEKFGFSIRPFGFQNIHELQFLAFMSICQNCTLISSWDFGVEELTEILKQPVHPPFAKIAWTYSPQGIKILIENSPEWMKPNLQKLLEIITPKQNGDEQK